MMFSIKSDALEECSRVCRYIYFLVSGCRFKSLSKWSDEGEPNPFVRRAPRMRVTSRQEIRDIFEDSLGRR
jgi:hypothetical protein